ncbi:MAG TPA: glycoside hydrolase family 16 protein [Anaeromyxobacter sp.]|nr:glycoside hydrolase family 16 protein [Anaeromyxobacter sp.]
MLDPLRVLRPRRSHVHRLALLGAALLAGCAGAGGGKGVEPYSYSIDEAGGLPAGYVLAWSDEFDGAGLPDASKWAYDTHANRTGWYNAELQYYANARTENSRVENGVLVIEARKESAAGFADAKSGAPQEYTSARLVTQGKQSWTYGFFEVRARIPCGKGIWPAIWLLSAKPDMRWPRDGEIDMMEHVNSEDRVHFTVHTADRNHAIQTQASVERSLELCDGAFHDYQLTWTAGEIKLGMDGRNYFQYRDEGLGYGQWPFNGPQYLLLNIAVGGSWPGAPDGSTQFPARMEVEHVRVYRAP